MIKYQTGGYGKDKIMPVEIERQTENSVYIDGRRCAKQSSYLSYFDSWQEAKDHLVKVKQNNVDSARRSLQRALDDLGNIKGIKEKTVDGEK